MDTNSLRELLFNGANLFVLPFWAVMIVLPRWSMTQKIMASPLPFGALALLYLYFFIQSFSAGSPEDFANPTLGGIARLFSQEAIAATGWVHYLVMDLFVGQWIYRQGVEKKIITTHSLTLCLFAGPLGLLSHLVTAAVAEAITPKETTAVKSVGT